MRNTILFLTLFLLFQNSYALSEEFGLVFNGKDDSLMEYKMVSQVRASHLLVSTKEEAEKLREEILAGKDFGDVAAEVSKCPSGARGGDLGFFGKGQMVPEFEEAAFTLEKGELSEPIQTQFGWHLLIVTDKK